MLAINCLYSLQGNQPMIWNMDGMVLVLICCCLASSCYYVERMLVSDPWSGAFPSPLGIGLLAALLLIGEVVAALNGPPFSSWDSSWWLVLLLPSQGLLHLALFFSFQDSIYGFGLWDDVVLWELCSPGGSGSGRMAWVLPLSHALLSSCWFSWLLWCCQQHTQSDDWAACEQPMWRGLTRQMS
jgi:hypothetical protein